MADSKKNRKQSRKKIRTRTEGATHEHWRDARHDEDAVDKVHRLELRELMMGSPSVSFYL
jgi:hypothetical protein